MMPLSALGASTALASAGVLLGSASIALSRSTTRTAFGEGATPRPSWAVRPNIGCGAAGSVIFSVHGPAGSPSQRTSNVWPNRPPGGKTASGRGNRPTCRR